MAGDGHRTKGGKLETLEIRPVINGGNGYHLSVIVQDLVSCDNHIHRPMTTEHSIC